MCFRKRITAMKKCAFRQQIYDKCLTQNIHHQLTFAAGAPEPQPRFIGLEQIFKDKDKKSKIKILGSDLELWKVQNITGQEIRFECNISIIPTVGSGYDRDVTQRLIRADGKNRTEAQISSIVPHHSNEPKCLCLYSSVQRLKRCSNSHYFSNYIHDSM